MSVQVQPEHHSQTYHIQSHTQTHPQSANQNESEKYEYENVHRVYDQIAAHFSETRYKVRRLCYATMCVLCVFTLYLLCHCVYMRFCFVYWFVSWQRFRREERRGKSCSGELLHFLPGTLRGGLNWIAD